MKRAADRELVRVGDRVVELAPRQPIEQLLGFRQRILDPRQVRIDRAPLLQRRRVRAAADDFDVAFVRLLDRARSRLVLAEDQVLAHLLVRRTEARVVRQADAARQAGRRDVRAMRFDLAHRIGHVRHGIHEQPHAQLRREAAGEIEFRSLRPGGAQVVGARQVARHDAQLPGTHDLLQHGRRLRAGAEQERRDDGQGGFQGAASSVVGRSGRLPAPALADRSGRRLQPGRASCRIRPPPERYRSGHNGTDSKSVEGITSLRGFESLPLRHFPLNTRPDPARRPRVRGSATSRSTAPPAASAPSPPPDAATATRDTEPASPASPASPAP